VVEGVIHRTLRQIVAKVEVPYEQGRFLNGGSFTWYILFSLLTCLVLTPCLFTNSSISLFCFADKMNSGLFPTVKVGWCDVALDL